MLEVAPGEDVGEQWANLDSQEQMESMLSSHMKGLKNERAEVELLLSAARRCEAKGPDIKAQALLDWIHKLQREENDPKLKVLVSIGIYGHYYAWIPASTMVYDDMLGRAIGDMRRKALEEERSSLLAPWMI